MWLEVTIADLHLSVGAVVERLEGGPRLPPRNRGRTALGTTTRWQPLETPQRQGLEPHHAPSYRRDTTGTIRTAAP
jgi:hypothetical protein